MTEHRPRLQVYATVLDRLHHEIAAGRLKPGDRLESMSQMAHRFGVGQSSVREAIRVLSYTGALRVKHGGGIFVNEPSVPEAQAMEHPAEDRASLWDLMELRLVVEPAAARLAAQRATFEERTEIRRRSEQNARAGAGGAMPEAAGMQDDDNEFHLVIVRATHNPLLLNLIEQVHGQLREGRFTLPKFDQLVESSARFHPQIAHSIMAHDPARAESFSRAHIEDAMWWLEQRASGHARQPQDATPGYGLTAEMPPFFER